MNNTLAIQGINWIHLVSPTTNEINDYNEQYELHELVVEDLLELNTQDKIDIYDDHISLVLHFPKYDRASRRYLLNELNVVLGKNYIISVTRFVTNTIERMRDKFALEVSDLDEDEKFKITPYYMLYEIIDIMYEKIFRLLTKMSKDMIDIEENLFENQINSQMISLLMIKRRNISFLKHNFGTQQDVIEELVTILPKFYENDLEVYFEDLSTKHAKIMSMIATFEDNITSMTETYNSLMNIQTNKTILLLTVFTAILLPLTLISGIYGMNVPLPFQHHPWGFWFIMIMMIVIGSVMLVLFRRKKNW